VDTVNSAGTQNGTGSYRVSMHRLL